MTKRLFAFLLVLAMLCALAPTVLAAPSPASTVNVTADLSYSLKGLKFNAILQNFYIDTDYIYVTQNAASGTFYLSRLKINGTTATYVDHMTLTNCDNGETLAGYHYNGKLYFYVGSKGLEATSYHSTQIARIQYEAGKTYTYTDLNRFTHLSNSTATGATLGSSNRVSVAANDLFTIFRIQTDDSAVTYSCYYTAALNKALDASKMVAMESAEVLGGFMYSFTQSSTDRVLPNNSFQGMELANSDMILVCGGNSGETPAIAMMRQNGTYQTLANITNIGTVSTGPIGIGADCVYIASVPDKSANANAYYDEQKIYSVQRSKLDIPLTANLTGTRGYTMSGLPFTGVIQNFYVDTDYIYVTQSNSTGTTYLSRLKISGSTATYVDHMTLTDCGNGETLAGYRYNGKLYFFVGAKGLAATSYLSVQIARVPYEAGKTYTYTDLNRFCHLANSTAAGTDLGTASRVGCSADEEYTVFRIALDDGTICYTIYDTKTINQALDSTQLIAMENAAVRSGFVYHFKQPKTSRVLPNNSFQGMELANLNNIMVSGGNAGETPAIGIMDMYGGYQLLAYITNVGTSLTGPIEYVNDRLYFVANTNAQIYYVEKDTLGVVDGTTASYTMDAASVLEAASYIKANMDANILPSTVTIGDKSCTNAQFLDLACKLLLNIVNGTPSEGLSFSDVAAPSSPSGTAAGTVAKEDYIAMARSICAVVESSHRVPNYSTSSSIGKMQHSYCVYMYAFLLDYYARYHMLPEAYASVTWNGSTAAPIAPSVPGVSTLETASATTIHQLPCLVPDTETGDYQQNLSLVVRTADGKTIVFDGGRYGEDAEFLFKYLQRITGSATPHVDAWFMTHAHSDHYGAFRDLVKNHGSQITLDAFYHRFPTNAEVDKYFASVEPETRKSQISYILSSVKSLKNADGGPVNIVTLNPIHSGKCNSTFDFGDLHIDVLLTFDDIMWAVDNISTKYTATWETHNANHENQAPKQLVAENFNNSSTVFRLTVGGKTIMITGDASTVSTIMLERYHKSHASDSSKYYSLKTDMVQMAHHGSRRGLSKAIYNLIDPDAVLWPVPKAGVTNAEKTMYPLQWISALGATTYYSYAGPQVLTFAPKRSAAATTIPEELKSLVFDAEYYAEQYPELKAAYGTDEAQLYNHFVNYGIEEGRCASPYFDVRFYMSNNGESLREHCHGDYTVAFAHFVKYAYDTTEKKSSPKMLSPTFDCAYYGKTYADLSAMTTEFQLLQHFATIGEAEGRLASQGFLSEDGYSYHKRSTRVVTEPTCTTAGSTSYTCTDCGYSCTVTHAPAIEHSYISEVTTAASCTDAGVTTYTCSDCGHSYTEAISATGHNAVIDEAVDATCTTEGKTEGSHCSICNAIIVAQNVIPATDHSYASEITSAPTCTTEGVKTFTCSVCGDSYTETIPTTGHTPVTDAAVAPTCINSGLTEGSHCSVCGIVLVAQETVARLGHDYSYTDNGNGTHFGTCSRCDKTITEEHEFTNGACDCGAKEIVAPTVDESIKIYHTLDLASDISITFAVPVSALASYDSYYLECALPEYEGNTQTGTSSVQIEPVLNGSYYYFTLTGITAVRMGDMVDAVLHMTKDSTEYISKTDSYSVATYAYAMLNSTTNTKMLTLCADLLRYGAEAQSFKKYRTDALVDAAMTEEQRAYCSDIEALTFTATDSYLGDLASPAIPWVGKTLDLGSKVGMKFVFNAKNYSGNIDSLSMKVSYTGSNGETKTVTVTGAEVYSSANSYYSFTFYGLLASELRTIVDVAIYDGETQLSQTLRYSAETYASKTGGTALEALSKALFAYSDSAKTFFAK